MIPNFNTTPPSHSRHSPIRSPITEQELKSLLRTWARNSSTNVSRADGTEIAKKILLFHKIETNSKYAPYRKQSLEITGFQAKLFPDIFSYPPFTQITNLNLQMGLSELPESIYHLHALKNLNLSNNNLERLSDKLRQLSQLQNVNLSHNRLNQLPENIYQLSKLQNLDVSFNAITEIPNNLDRLQNLTNLNLSHNNVSNVPQCFSQCRALTHLDLSSNKFSTLPESLTQISQLKELNLCENNIASLPDVSQWKEIHRLDLRNNKFTEWSKDLEILSERAVVLLDHNFSTWKATHFLPESQSDSESSYVSDSESSDEDIVEKPNRTLHDRIDISNNSSPAEGIRKRKAEKFIQESEIARKVLKKNPPLLITDDGGSSFKVFGEIKDKPIGVYKPRLQSEKERVAGVTAGTEAFRERLAYALNYELSQLFTESNIPLVDFGIPPTRIMDFTHKLFGKHNKTGSLQKYRKNCVNLYNASARKKISTNKDELFKAAILDLIFLNKDRHEGNLLYSEQKNKINLIDHGACFPEILGLQKFELGWKNLSFIHEPLPQNWANFIVSINIDTLVTRTIKEIEIHTKAFPEEEMNISGESLFVMIFAIKSLQQFIKTNEAPTIGQYLDHLLSKDNFHYVEIKNPSDNTTSFQQLSEELPLGYIHIDSIDKDMKKFTPNSFDVMGVSIMPLFNEETTPSAGELRLKEMCEKYGFENVVLYRKEFVESQFYEQTKEAFQEYTKDKEGITAHFIHENLDEVEKHITSYLSAHPIRSLSDRLRGSSK